MASGSIGNRIALNVTSAIAGLNLATTDGQTGSIGSNVFNHVIPEQLAPASALALPCVIVEVARQPIIDQNAGDFEQRFLNYRTRCLVLDHARENYQKVQDDYEQWLESIGSWADGLVKYPLLPDVLEVHRVMIGEVQVLDHEAARSQKAKGWIDMTWECHTARVRNG